MRSLAANLLHVRSDAQWALVAHDGGDVLPIRTFPCGVGRHPGLPIRIVHPTVSLNHAEFRKEAGDPVIRGERSQDPGQLF